MPTLPAAYILVAVIFAGAIFAGLLIIAAVAAIAKKHRLRSYGDPVPWAVDELRRRHRQACRTRAYRDLLETVAPEAEAEPEEDEDPEE